MRSPRAPELDAADAWIVSELAGGRLISSPGRA